MNDFPISLNFEPCFKISCTIDIVPPSNTEFQEAIQITEKGLEKIATEQQKIAANLQARNAPPEKIDSRYTLWTQQLSNLSSEISICRSKLAQLIEKLPFIDDLSICKEGFEKLTTLSQRSYRLEKANIKLKLFSDSPELRKTLELCKEIIQKCEKETNASSIPLDSVITELQEELTDKHDELKDLKSSLRTAIIAIHADTLRFLAYVAKEVNAKDTGGRITNLMKKISSVDTEATNKELSTNEERLLQNAKDVELPNNRYFRNGIYGANWRYPTIYPIVEKMQNSARGLQVLETDLEGKIQRAWQGQLTKQNALTKENWQSYLTTFKTIITKQREQLYDIPFCNEVHSGLHYAASLFTWIDDLQDSVAFLLKTTDDSWLKVGELHLLFRKQLTPPKQDISYASNTYGYIKDINVLIRTLQEVSKLDNQNPFFIDHKNQIQKAITTRLWRMRSSIFELSSKEQTAQKQILSKTHLSCDLKYTAFECHPQQKSLLSKRIIHCLHFTNEPFDISLDLMLTMMETQPLYIAYFNELLHMDEHCKQLIMKYKPAASVDEDKELLKELCEIYYLLQNALQESNQKETKQQELAHFFEYSKYRQRIIDLKQTATNTRERARFQSFLRLTKDMAKELQNKYKSPNYAHDLSKIIINPEAKITEPVMYKLLLKALWSLSPESQLEARNMIELVIDKPECNFMNDDIKSLLKALSLHSFLDQMYLDHTNTAISRLQKVYLPQLILERLENASYGLTIYSMGTMETALYHLLSIQELVEHPLLAEAIATFTNGQFYPVWEKTMKEYLEFKNKYENKPVKLNSTEHKSRTEYLKTLQKTYKNTELNKKEFKRDRLVLKELHHEMKNMLIIER